MELTMHRYHYKSFGLNIISEISLPELFPKKDIFEEDTVEIKIVCDVSDFRDQLSNKKIIIKKDFLLFEVPNVAIFCVKDGNKIIVDPFNGASEGKIRLYLLGSCIGALLLQRKILPLHGSAVEINGKAYAIVGHSGAGKSTLASSFIKQGFRLISDDVIPVSFVEGTPIVKPSYPHQKLWQQSLIEFGMDYKKFNPLFERETKYQVPVTNFVLKPIPFAGVIELDKTDGSQIQLREIYGIERLRILLQHTYRRSFIPKLGLIDWHFKECLKVIKEIQVMQMHRPTTPFTANQLRELILDSINDQEEILL